MSKKRKIPSYDFELDRAKAELLNSIKKQVSLGPMRPTLFKMLQDFNRDPIPYLQFQWMFYAGMGNTDLAELKDQKRQEAAKSLLESGQLVLTFKEDFYNAQIQRISHFDDVNWGKDKNGDIIIYNLANFENQKDQVITADEIHDDAIDALKRRIEYKKTMEDTAITLSDGATVTPILTNPDVIKYRQKQLQKPPYKI